MVFLQLANFLRKEHPTDLRLILDNGHMTKMIRGNIIYVSKLSHSTPYITAHGDLWHCSR